MFDGLDPDHGRILEQKLPTTYLLFCLQAVNTVLQESYRGLNSCSKT